MKVIDTYNAILGAAVAVLSYVLVLVCNFFVT